MSKGGKKGRGTRGLGGKVVPISRSTAFTRLKAMKCFRDIHQRLVDGWPLTEVARYIQNTRGEYTDISKESLVGVLHKYRATIPAAEFAKKTPGTLPAAIVEKIEEAQKGLDELIELEKLYKLQMERVGIDLQNEKNIKKLLPTMTQEIRVAKELVESYAQLKMDLGINERNLGTVNVEGEVGVSYGNPAVAKVLSNAESRRKLLGVAQRLLQTAGSAKMDELTTETDAEVIPAAEVELEVQAASPPALPEPLEDIEPDLDAILNEVED